jgi:hypothetical protein
MSAFDGRSVRPTEAISGVEYDPRMLTYDLGRHPGDAFGDRGFLAKRGLDGRGHVAHRPDVLDAGRRRRS